MPDIATELKAAFADEATPQQSDFWRLIDLADRARNAVGANPARPGLGPGLSLDDKGVIQISDGIWSRLLHREFLDALNTHDPNFMPGEMNVIFELLQSASKGTVSNASWSVATPPPADGDVAPTPRGASGGQLRSYFSAGNLPREASYAALIDTACQAVASLGMTGTDTNIGRGLKIENEKISTYENIELFSYDYISSMPDEDKAWIFYNISSAIHGVADYFIE